MGYQSHAASASERERMNTEILIKISRRPAYLLMIVRLELLL
jgi:hypothetical protein